MPGGPQYASPPPWAEGCGVGAISFRKQSRKGPGGGRGGPVGSTPTSVAMMQKGLFGAGGAHVVTLPPPPPQCHISILVPKCPPAPPPMAATLRAKSLYWYKNPILGGEGKRLDGGGHTWDGMRAPTAPPAQRGGGVLISSTTPQRHDPKPFFFWGGHHPQSFVFGGGGGDWTGILPPSPPHPPPPH